MYYQEQSAVLHDSDVLVMLWPRSEAELSADTGHRSGKVSGWPSSLESFKQRLNEGSPAWLKVPTSLSHLRHYAKQALIHVR